MNHGRRHRLDRWQAECTRIGLIEDGNGNSARALFLNIGAS